MAGLDPAIQPARIREPKRFWMAGSGAGHDEKGEVVSTI
jgi:hypothetical protein